MPRNLLKRILLLVLDDFAKKPISCCMAIECKTPMIIVSKMRVIEGAVDVYKVFSRGGSCLSLDLGLFDLDLIYRGSLGRRGLVIGGMSNGMRG